MFWSLSRLLAIAPVVVLGQQPTFGQWCGKYYQVGAPQPTSRPDGSLFPYPDVSQSPLLDFQCVTASSLYLENDGGDPPMILIDANITYDVGQAYYDDWNGQLDIEVYTDGWQFLAGGSVGVNTMGNLIPFNTTSLKACATPYNLTCKATINGQEFWTNSTLSYLPPNPYGGNVVKVDRTSGALIVKNDTGNGEWDKIIPFGWYDSYNTTTSLALGADNGKDARAETLARLHSAKDLGFNLVHIVPPGGYEPYTFSDEATEQFEEYLDLAQSLGLWLVYDMRNSFLNLSSVEYQVNYLKNRSNILSWYTGDEPDGAVYDLNSTKLAYDLIYQLDGYHPVSLVLNCENYFFKEYGLDGSDLLLVDPYPIALNGAWSKRYNTPVNTNFGDSGCDNCQGTFYDQTTRVDSSIDRARVVGKYRTVPIWMVPQAFDDGQQEFWYRVPTGDEESVQTILAWNHGAMGHCAWNSQYATPDLLGNASAIANQLYSQSRFIVGAHDTRQQVYSNLTYGGENGYDLASWTIQGSNGTETLVMAVNFNYPPSDTYPPFTLANVTGTVSQVLFGNVTTQDDGTPLFTMPRTSVAGVILKS